MNEVSPHEFWVFWGLIIAARVFGKQGDVWVRAQPDGIKPAVNFTKYMSNKSIHAAIKRHMDYLFNH